MSDQKNETRQDVSKPSQLELLSSQFAKYHTPNYAPSMALVKGKGAYVWDADGNKYLDFVSGIAVTALGHCHPRQVKALKKQLGKLMHVSNLYYNTESPKLAEALSTRSLGGKVFFSNSGAEANEAMIKLARLWGQHNGKNEIITFENSFHGRTLATLTATGQEKVQKGFHPLPGGFKYAKYNDMGSVRAQLTPRTVAIMLEPVQAEGGVIPAEPAFVKELAELCRENGLLLLMDEVQTGMGRTGEWFGYQQHDIQPDAISLAKGLGGGFPVGALVTSEKLQDILTAGTHGSTFGGQPLAATAAMAVIEVMEDKELVGNAKAMGELLHDRLSKLIGKYSFVRSIRGQGLLQGIVLDQDAKDLERILTRKGLLTVATAGNVIRLLPPLNVSASQVKKAVRMIDKACAEWQDNSPSPKENSSS